MRRNTTVTKSFALTFAALALSVGAALVSPVAASAAGYVTAQNSARQELGVPAGESPTASFAEVAHSPGWTSWLDYQNGVPLRPLVGVSQNPNIHPLDSAAALLNSTTD